MIIMKDTNLVLEEGLKPYQILRNNDTNPNFRDIDLW